MRARAITMGGLLALAVLLPAGVQATPRYAARYRQNCNLCHHNPTGGGMRSSYASQYLVPTEMVIKPLPPEKLAKIQPQLSESVAIGTDIRTIHHWADVDRQSPELNFFQMQGDLYVLFQADERLSAYLDRGQSTTQELFGLAYVLPWTGFVKFGRFTPAYGWKFDDHRLFTREGKSGDNVPRDLFFEPPGHTDVGIEVGLYPGNFALVASVLNGAFGSTSDFDQELGNTAQLSYRFDLGPLGFALGGSWLRNVESGGQRTAAGPFWAVQAGPFAWLGEVDWSELEATDSRRTALLTSHEVSWRLIRGLDLRGVFNYADPDIDQGTGLRVKTGGGLDALVAPFLGIKAMVNYYRNDVGLHVNDLDYTQSEFMLHLFY